MSDDRAKALEYHEKPVPGKVSIQPTKPFTTSRELSLAYTPGVAVPVEEIARDPENAYRYTNKGNLVAVITDGSAVLGLGNVGALAGKPVMEGKAVLFKRFANIDVFDIEVTAPSTEAFIETVVNIAPTFGGINLEDIAAPAAFDIEERLVEALDIPVFHDDQHGTAVVALAGLENALKLVGKNMADLRVVIAGVGAAGMAVSKILLEAGVGDVIGTDRLGVVHRGRTDLNEAKRWLAENSNADNVSGSVGEALADADVFLGVSAPGLITREDVQSMAKDPIVFAMANPDPEILPAEVEGIVSVMATGRSDYPNQINNVLAFPGIFRGALDARASDITENMKLAAAAAIADSVSPDELTPDFIVPSVFDKAVPMRVAAAVEKAAISDGVARR